MRGSFLFATVMVLASWARAEVEIRVIYDNTSARAGVQQDWGFAAVVTVMENESCSIPAPSQPCSWRTSRNWGLSHGPSGRR